MDYHRQGRPGTEEVGASADRHNVGGVTPQPIYRGKVRDIYDAGDGLLLFVTSDRISAFDVVMAEPIPDKGRVLTALTAFWLDLVVDLTPNHLVSIDPSEFPATVKSLPDLAGRSMLVKQADMLAIECIVRGYLSGSAWKEYSLAGTMHGTRLPEGLRQSDALPEAVFTPSTKAETGHDENITVAAAASLVGDDVVKEAQEISLAVYRRGAQHAAERGLIIADTKFELGWIDGQLALCDEVLTPDSSRFWDAATYEPGTSPPSFDKQPVRDWLESTGWDKSPPPPSLPTEVVDATRERYVAAYERLTGKRFDDWPGVGG
jgi:phosphoribosylaminoimidazole-succinocarboxamide synthase